MTGIVKNGALTATTQMVSIASQMAPTTITLISGAGTRKIRLSTARFPAGETFFDPAVDGTAPGAISCAVLSPMCWVEFTGDIGNTYEII